MPKEIVEDDLIDWFVLREKAALIVEESARVKELYSLVKGIYNQALDSDEYGFILEQVSPEEIIEVVSDFDEVELSDHSIIDEETDGVEPLSDWLEDFG